MSRPSATTPPGAYQVFGERLALAEAYVAQLADTGISHGLIGPREAPRLWDRHVLNSAVVAPLFDPGSTVADIGSGAGLPGIPLAIARPDLEIVLVEPLQRRVVWLTGVVRDLGLAQVTVHHGRAESLWGQRRFRFVTARAVAATAALASLTLPLLEAPGDLHALKGERAQSELDRDRAELAGLGATRLGITRWGEGVVDPMTAVLTVGVDVEVRLPAPGGTSVSDTSRTARPSRSRTSGPSGRSVRRRG